MREVQRNGDLHLVPIWITVEGLGYTGDELLRYFKIRLHDRTKDLEIQKVIKQFELKQFADFDPLMRSIYQNTQRRIVLVIDEFDDIPDDRVSEIMHIFRSLYHERDVHALHSLALGGVRNISGVVLDRASPFTPLDRESIVYKDFFVCYPTGFNIADEIETPYFSRAEVEGVIGQYEAESGQKFHKKVVAKIYENILGQPGLVNSLCRELVEKFCPDPRKSVDMAGFRNAMNYFLIERIARNISPIINKANEQKAKGFPKATTSFSAAAIRKTIRSTKKTI